MKYYQYTNKSKFWIKRVSHNARFQVAIKLCTSDNGQSKILDYGTGAAHFLKLLADLDGKMQLVGFEPVKHMFELAQSETAGLGSIRIVDRLEGLDKNFDYVTCLEVLEHLREEDQTKAIENSFNHLKKDGRVIISVPIETGFASFCKNTVRAIISQTHSKSFKNILKAAFGMKVERDFGNIGYCHSHMGFRHKDLERVFQKNNWRVTKKVYSPFNMLSSFINSQIFYILSKD